MKKIEESKDLREGRDRYIVVRNPAGRWTVIVLIDKSVGGSMCAYDFFQV